jgi:hypothetical protein
VGLPGSSQLRRSKVVIKAGLELSQVVQKVVGGHIQQVAPRRWIGAEEIVR